MKFALKRLVCCVKGHKPFPKREYPPVPLPGNSIASLGTITGTYLNSSGNWSNTGGSVTSDGSGLHLHTGPVISTAFVCARCHGVIWNTKVNPSYFTDSNNLPELANYRGWQCRQRWEEKQRSKNELANKLYQQYQVALKLGHVAGEADDAA